MKKAMSVCAVAAVVLGASAARGLAAGAAREVIGGEALKSYFSHAGGKLERGATNLARAGTEFYFQPLEARRTSGRKISMLWPGLGEAFGMFLTRAIGGALELATSPIPFPNGWKPLLEE